MSSDRNHCHECSHEIDCGQHGFRDAHGNWWHTSCAIIRGHMTGNWYIEL